ncbi:MAG: prolipoprotein diacylglyceryl transferase [Gammaproteobacteria bacterium]|nr:prolipoprotein diacylglyceryl transferase [Gammaproteobacteria bacterium]
MLTHPNINPIALDLGPIKIHWYGVMYLVAFVLAAWLGLRRAREPGSGWGKEQVLDLIFYSALGVILGGRIGYMLFYALPNFIANPLIVFKVWEGGMSFHGGLVGVIFAMWMFGRRYQKTFFQVADFSAPLVPLGYFFGRMGNFINGELWGRVTDAPWGMLFPFAGPLPRHPSQLYQGVLEGLVVFGVLWCYSARRPPRMAVSAMFLILFGGFRIFNEFFREPDAQLGFIAFNWLTMGQLLSVPMVIAGGLLLRHAYVNIQKSDVSNAKSARKKSGKG